jgi:hypothetical protein
VKLNWKGIFLWSNQFYGICAVLLAVDSNLIILNTIPNIFILLLIHLSTVVYYTHAYLQENHDGIYDERSKWYQQNYHYIKFRQIAITCLCVWLGFFKLRMFSIFLQTPIWMQLIIFLSILISVIYYLPNFHFFSFKSFRHKGIFKSLSIAWVWSIICCMLPIWYSLGKNFTVILTKYIFWNHFIYLFLFILVLSILFDIKDLYRDKLELINTIVAKHGIPFTINKIILPIIIFLISFVIAGYFYHVNSEWQVVVNLVILVLTFFVTQKVINQTSIHINILLIDGLIIIKSLLSILMWQYMPN